MSKMIKIANGREGYVRTCEYNGNYVLLMGIGLDIFWSAPTH